ncbi:MAG: hypothetical protein HFE50_01575 [Clostridia bacterium]|nr:hypothetical protein [Clostridia bacterium]
MKKTKKLLSLLTALTITASAFAGLAVPASADTYFTQDYQSATAVDWYSKDADAALSLETDGDNKYLKFDISKLMPNDRGAELIFDDSVKRSAGSAYAVEFDMAVKSSTDDHASAFAILGTGHTYVDKNMNYNVATNAVLSMTAPSKSDTWKIGGTTDVKLDSTAFYHYTMATEGKVAYLTITDSDGTEVLEKTLFQVAGDGGLDGLYFMAGRKTASMSIDNIVVRDIEENEIPQIQYYTATINTNRYATMTKEDGTKLYADVNGKIEIPLLQDGTEIEYTLSKTGYESKTGKITINKDDFTVNEQLEIEQSGGEEETIYVESDFGNADGAFVTPAGSRGATMELGEINLPDVATFSMDFSANKAEEVQATWVLKNKEGKIVVGLQGNASGLIAFTGWNGSAGMNNNTTDDKDTAMTNKVKIADSYYDSVKNISFVIDSANKNITVKCGNVTTSLPLIEDASTLTSMSTGKYRNYAQLTVDNVKVTQPDPDYVQIIGDAEFAKISGKTVTREYKAAPVVMVPSETFTWTVANESGEAVAGVSIDQNGVLSVEDTAAAGTVTVSAVSSVSADKKGELEVNIRDFANLIPTVEYPKVMNIGESAKLKVTQIVDQYGDDVTEYFSPTWSIDDVPSLDTDVTFDTTDKTGDAVAISVIKENGILQSVSTQNVTISGNETTVAAEGGSTVMLWDSLEGMKPLALPQIAPEATIGEDVIAAVGAKSGTIKANNVGDVTVKLTLREGQEPEQYRIDIGNYYKVLDYSEVVDNQVDISDLAEDESVTGYQVTVADADGGKLAQEVVQAVDVKVAVPAVETGTPAKVEVAPVYTGVMNTEYLIPAASYDVTATVNNGARTDLYVNDQMIFNNLNQDSDKWKLYNRTLKSSEDYTSKGVIIAQGSATFKYMDDKSGGTTVTAVKFVRTPSVVKRARQIYVIGDSLVANYHGEPTAEGAGYVRTGWGQVLQSYIKDADVINLGNSGAWATGMYNDAFTRVRQSAQLGDIVVWESGYNDDSHGGAAPMKEAMAKVASECKSIGANLYFVTPNASYHDYKENVKLSGAVREVASETNTKLIDLAKNSYVFLSSRYGTDNSKAINQLIPCYNNAYNDSNVLDGGSGDKGLHSSFNAANCWAAIVAQGLYDSGLEDIINTEYKYTFNDGINDISVGVTAK